MNALLTAIQNIMHKPTPLEEPQQQCNKCGNVLPVTHFHLRRDRAGEQVRRKTCRSCTAKVKGKPGRKVRPA